nr:13718_t:CDS:2 [Entrophospora candida]
MQTLPSSNYNILCTRAKLELSQHLNAEMIRVTAIQEEITININKSPYDNGTTIGKVYELQICISEKRNMPDNKGEEGTSSLEYEPRRRQINGSTLKSSK